MPKEAIVKEQEQKKVEKKWAVGQVAATTKDVVVDTETNQAFTIEEALVLILNKLDDTL